MELDLGPEVAAFRQEIRSWIEKNAPKGLADLTDWNNPPGGHGSSSVLQAYERALASDQYKAWEKTLQDARYICPGWPVEVGGSGWNPVQIVVFNEELYRAGVPRIQRGMGESLVGPSVIVHGTPEQKAYFLPRIIDGTDRYCQGFSEPNHGSDLAAAETRGVVEGDNIVINGQKVWTSGAHLANHIFILCRTDPDVPKHRGLSFVLADFNSDNGVTVRQLRQLSGASGFCEDFFDNTKAPLFNVIGGLNNGWQVAMTTLTYERGGRATLQYLGYEREFWELVETARKYGRDKDPLIRQRLAWAYTHVQLMRFSGLRTLAELAQGKAPGPAASTNKLFWSDYHQKLGELAVEIVGADSLVRPEGDGLYPTDKWQATFLSSRAETIFSGTNQIQRNIIGERVLGLPKEPKVASDT